MRFYCRRYLASTRVAAVVPRPHGLPPLVLYRDRDMSRSYENGTNRGKSEYTGLNARKGMEK